MKQTGREIPRPPAYFGRNSIGHFGFFRESVDDLWREPRAWLGRHSHH